MNNNSLFRKSFFGGLNKEDVEEYIQNLEHEIESVKVLHQKEKNELLKKIEEYEENGGSGEETSRLLKNAEELGERIQKLQQENRKLAGEKETLEAEKKNLEAEKISLEESLEEALSPGNPEKDAGSVSRDGEEEIWKQEYLKVRKENEELKKQIREQEEKEEREGKESGKKEEPFFDYDTVAKIIEQANQNAEMIKDEARQEAKQMLEDVQKEVEYERSRVSSQVNSQLEEKGIQLMAAKYKIEQYVKEIDSLQQGMYNLSSRMSKLVNTMPVRLDDYWEGEHYRMLESRKARSEEKNREGEEQ